jgi:hypothetical protein
MVSLGSASDVIMSVEVIEATEVFKTTEVLKINKLMARITLFRCLKKNICEQNDGISSEILPSFRTEAFYGFWRFFEVHSILAKY